jgi:retron-type reverse transcriptase
MGRIHDLYSTIISIKNLFIAWKEFVRGKKNKNDVSEFTVSYEQELFSLHRKLVHGTYSHGGYHVFVVRDPKRRNIHKASVRDRVLHHTIHRILVPIFETGFIFDSYSSRKNKGVHLARERFQKFAWKLSQNNTKTVWILKCDIRKFFDCVNHEILIKLLSKRISCENTVNLLKNIIRSYEWEKGRGIPLGNLTSQLFSNVYMDPFDQFMKREMRVKYYLRYADDFVILSRDKEYLEELIEKIKGFFAEQLKLEVHPNKIEIKKWHTGIDFLGAVMFPYFCVLRTKTKRRTIKKIQKSINLYQRGEIEYENMVSTIRSYLGIMMHVDSFGLKNQIMATISSFSKDEKPLDM